MRVVSLLPSATEISFGLGIGESVVGVTFECDYPSAARAGRAVVVGGLDTHGLDAAGIDALVRAKVAAGEDMYVLDADLFRSLDADVVLTQDLCRVCALPAGRVEDAMAALDCQAEVVTLDPHTLAGIFDCVLAVGRATGATPAANALVASLRARLDKVAAATATALASGPRPRVFMLEWPDPPFVAGHWVPELVHSAGGEAVLARPGERSVPTTWEQIALADPDVVVIASCGFDATGTAVHAAQVMDMLPSRCAVWAIDANGLIVRPGPRVVDGVETLAAILHGINPVAVGAAVLIRSTT